MKNNAIEKIVLYVFIDLIPYIKKVYVDLSVKLIFKAFKR